MCMPSYSQGFPPRGKQGNGVSAPSGIITAGLLLDPQCEHESISMGLDSPHFRHFQVSVEWAIAFSLSLAVGAVLTRCRMTKYQMKPKPHKKKATTANTTNGLKAMPSTREPLERSLEQSIAAHKAVSNPNKKLAATVNKPTSRKFTTSHNAAGMTTCGGQPLLGCKPEDSVVVDGGVTSSKGCWSSEHTAASSGCSFPQYVQRFMRGMLTNDPGEAPPAPRPGMERARKRRLPRPAG
jgi:hypothetical protein